MKLNIAIVDDHRLFADGLKYYLSSLEQVDNIDYYEGGSEFINNINAGVVPDVVFMDICMPVKNGIETTKEAKGLNGEIKIIAMSSLLSVEHIEGMIEAGANGYLLKSSSIEEIEMSIKETMKGNDYFSSNVLTTLTKRNIRRTLDTMQVVNKISDREMEVLRLICSGYDKFEIADMLNISDRTVDKHRENIMEKTASENVIQLMIFSLKNNLVTINT